MDHSDTVAFQVLGLRVSKWPEQIVVRAPKRDSKQRLKKRKTSGDSSFSMEEGFRLKQSCPFMLVKGPHFYTNVSDFCLIISVPHLFFQRASDKVHTLIRF